MTALEWTFGSAVVAGIIAIFYLNYKLFLETSRCPFKVGDLLIANHTLNYNEKLSIITKGKIYQVIRTIDSMIVIKIDLDPWFDKCEFKMNYHSFTKVSEEEADLYKKLFL